MRSEYSANEALQAPSRYTQRQTPNASLMARNPDRRTLWGLLFFWL